MEIEQALIVGAGPSGLAAALQLQRYGIAAHVFERARPGGLLWNANLIENYPGFPGGIPGPNLARIFAAQARKANIHITPDEVLSLSWQDGLFQAQTSHNTFQARATIIASGTKPRKLDISIPEALSGKVFSEVYPLLHVTGKKIIILGAGDAAFDYALNLGRRNSVIILNRSGQLKCLPLLKERANACSNLTYYPNTAIARLAVSDLGGVRVECLSPGGPVAFESDYFISAIGREAQLDFVTAELQQKSAELQKKGILHLVGDVKNGLFRQAAIAVGDGIRAGMILYKALEEPAHESNRLDW